jgi:hypothetical protein
MSYFGLAFGLAIAVRQSYCDKQLTNAKERHKEEKWVQ